MAEGEWEAAGDVWRRLQGEMARSNEAVCELYMGRVENVCAVKSTRCVLPANYA